MIQGVIVDELLDFSWQAEQGRVHDVGKISSQRLDVVAGLGRSSGRHPVHPISFIKHIQSSRSNHLPVVFGRIDEIIDLRIDKLENALFRGLLVTPELFSGAQSHGPPGGCGGSSSNQKLLQLLTGNLEVFKVDQNLHYLTQIL